MAAEVLAYSSDSLIDALKIPGPQRKPEDLAPIIDFVKGLKIFSSFSSMHPETLSKISAAVEMQYHYKGSHVFVEGQPGQSFFIVLEGEVAIVRKRAVVSKSTRVNSIGYGSATTETTTLATLGVGKYFGENALESKDGLRTATALTTLPSRLLVLLADDYKAILAAFKNVIKMTLKAYLSSSTSVFACLTGEQIEELASFAVVRSVSSCMCMFVCLYVCMFVCLYVCMFVCLYVVYVVYGLYALCIIPIVCEDKKQSRNTLEPI
jgi:hypothetical protein